MVGTVNHFSLTVNARRHTTREGDHKDDVAYIDQLAGTVADRLFELGFLGQVNLILLNDEKNLLSTTIPIVRQT